MKRGRAGGVPLNVDNYALTREYFVEKKTSPLLQVIFFHQ